MTTMTTINEIQPNATTLLPTPDTQNDNTLLLGSVIGGALLGLLFLTVVVVIIISIVMAISRRRKRSLATQGHRMLYHENSAVSLISRDHETEGISLLLYSSYMLYFFV